MDVIDELIFHLQVPESILYLRKEGLDPNIIPDPEARSFAQWVMDYVSKYGVPPNADTIQNEWDLSDPEPNSEVGYVLDSLRERWLKKQSRSVTETLAEATADPREWSETLVREAVHIRNATASQRYHFESSEYPEIIQGLKDKIQNKEPGFSYGFPNLDWHTAGAEKTHLSFLAARPKRFKSWILLKTAVEQRIQGWTPVLFTLELSREEMAERLLCLVSGVSYSRMKRKQLLDKDLEAMGRSMESFTNKYGPIHIVAPPPEERTAEALLLETERLGGQSILVDQLSYIGTSETFYRENEKFQHIVHTMKRMAMSAEIPWYVVCQLNREAANLEQMADASMVGLTRAIEETCDILLGLHRTEDDDENDVVELHVMEARHCTPGYRSEIMVDLKKTTNFEEYQG